MSRHHTAYLYLAGFFIAALVACNLLVNKFFTFTYPAWLPFLGGTVAVLSVGIIPYPLTFLVTDILSEVYGRRRANRVVLVGFVVSLFTLGIVLVGTMTRAVVAYGWHGPWQEAPSVEDPVRWQSPLRLTLRSGTGLDEHELLPPGGGTSLDSTTALCAALDDAGNRSLGRHAGLLHFSWEAEWAPDLSGRTGRGRLRIDDNEGLASGTTLALNGDAGFARLWPAPAPHVELRGSPVSDDVFRQVFGNTWRAILASMVAYLIAQWFDIQLFHLWKRLTRGRHLWFRNNASTIFSQLLDTSLVVSILFWGTENEGRIPAFIVSGWIFKALVALGDTPFFYLGVWIFRTFRLAPPDSEYSSGLPGSGT